MVRIWIDLPSTGERSGVHAFGSNRRENVWGQLPKEGLGLSYRAVSCRRSATLIRNHVGFQSNILPHIRGYRAAVPFGLHLYGIYLTASISSELAKYHGTITASNPEDDHLCPGQAHVLSIGSLLPSRSGIFRPAIAVVVVSGSVRVAVIVASCPLSQTLATFGISTSPRRTVMENSDLPSLLE